MSDRPPLEGVTVVELAHIMAGPVCGLMLADLGADVIKVERVPGGDPTRAYTPPTVDGESAAFMIVNRNKRGVAVDLKTDAGREIVRRMLARADVVVENYRAGTMARLGLAYEELRDANPGLIYCEISGFGRTGPFGDAGGFDLIAQGYSGLMSVTGEGPGRPPVKCGVPLTDVTAGILAAMGIAAAYADRLRTGRGRRVETSLFEAGVALTYWQSAIALATGVSPGPMGSAHPLSAPYETFRTEDGWINLGASSQASWHRLVGALDEPALAADERFRENAGRMAHRAELAEILGRCFARRSTAEWVERLAAAGVPAGPVLTVGEMLEHPQTVARDMVIDVGHARLGSVRAVGPPVKLDGAGAGGRPRRGAPVLGQHTREVLREHGVADAEIDRLAAEGVVIDGGAGPRPT